MKPLPSLSYTLRAHHGSSGKRQLRRVRRSGAPCTRRGAARCRALEHFEEDLSVHVGHLDLEAHERAELLEIDRAVAVLVGKLDQRIQFLLRRVSVHLAHGISQLAHVDGATPVGIELVEDVLQPNGLLLGGEWELALVLQLR
jgi:hypothetical protein